MRAKFPLLFLDVDSTLVTVEGIDVLAGGDPEVARLTEAAMDGSIPVDEVYGRRLDLVRPSRAAIEELSRTYLASLVPGARATVAALRDAGVEIHILSAGLEPAILPLAASLAIEPRAVHAVGVSFTEEGAYAGFDRRSPLVRSGGKELVVLDVRARTKGRAALVGDGATDLEAKGAVDLFIGFGGVTIRPRVRDGADVFVTDRSLEAILPHLLERDD